MFLFLPNKFPSGGKKLHCTAPPPPPPPHPDHHLNSPPQALIMHKAPIKRCWYRQAQSFRAGLAGLRNPQNKTTRETVLQTAHQSPNFSESKQTTRALKNGQNINSGEALHIPLVSLFFQCFLLLCVCQILTTRAPLFCIGKLFLSHILFSCTS